MEYEIGSEIVIGLVGAVGTEQQYVCNLLADPLGKAGYKLEIIKISRDVIPQFGKIPDYGLSQYTRLSNLMDAGNEARKKTENNGILALGAASQISLKRIKDQDGKLQPASKKAYVIDSLKTSEEVLELRKIYRSGFVLIGIHANSERRKEHLIRARGMSEQEATRLMQRDEDEAKVPEGQRVIQTFHMSDFFVHLSDDGKEVRADINRFVELIFGNPFITPTFDEHAMFMAFASSLRSGDMSRQVGAVVARDYSILATGANDCPKAGGGQYWPERNPESGMYEDKAGGRDYTRTEGDSNRAEQRKIIEKIVDDGVAEGLDKTKLRTVLERSPIKDLTEYGRVVHAEMEALLSCTRNGISAKNATIFCTTFPCHNCAKHIIAAGIERVVFVEPYQKSKAFPFHDDSILPEANASQDKSKLRFEAFVGVGPRRFFDLFSMQFGASYDLIRKDKDGTKRNWHIHESRLRLQLPPMTYLEQERSASTNFLTALSEMGQEKKPVTK